MLVGKGQCGLFGRARFRAWDGEVDVCRMRQQEFDTMEVAVSCCSHQWRLHNVCSRNEELKREKHLKFPLTSVQNHKVFLRIACWSLDSRCGPWLHKILSIDKPARTNVFSYYVTLCSPPLRLSANLRPSVLPSLAA